MGGGWVNILQCTWDVDYLHQIINKNKLMFPKQCRGKLVDDKIRIDMKTEYE